MKYDWKSLLEGVTSSSAEETAAWGEALGRALPDDSIVTLWGDLGAGKTTFVQGLARALGITTRITSPTFNLYALHRGTRNLAHCDAYRLESPGAFDALHLEELLESPWILALEWPGNVASDWLDHPWALQFSMGAGPGQRHLLLQAPEQGAETKML